MTLEDCTKEELIMYIKREGYDQRDIEFVVLMLRAKKASELAQYESKKACDALGKYIDFLKPYEGSTYMDIPDPVTLKAARAYKSYERHTAAAHRYDSQWAHIQKQIDKLMGR